MSLKITLHLPDGTVVENANFARVLIEDGKPGIRQRMVESLVRDADELFELQKRYAKVAV